MLDFGTSVAKEEPKDKIGLYKGVLPLQPVYNVHHYYSITTTFFNKEDQEVKRFRCSITLFYKKTEDGKRICRLDKSDFLIDRKKPSLLIEEIVLELSEVFYPLEVVLRANGTVEGIHNGEEIFERWEKQKENIKRKYAGSIFRKMIAQFDKTIKNPAKCEGLLDNDILFPVFFHNNYSDYSKSYAFDNSMYLKLNESDSLVEFKGVNSIVLPKETDKNKSLRIKFKGRGTFGEKHPLSRNLKSKETSGYLNAIYHLEEKTHLPEMVQLTCSFFDENDIHLKSTEVLIVKDNSLKKQAIILEELKNSEEEVEMKNETNEKGWFGFLKK